MPSDLHANQPVFILQSNRNRGVQLRKSARQYQKLICSNLPKSGLPTSVLWMPMRPRTATTAVATEPVEVGSEIRQKPGIPYKPPNRQLVASHHGAKQNCGPFPHRKNQVLLTSPLNGCETARTRICKLLPHIFAFTSSSEREERRCRRSHNRYSGSHST